MGAQTQVTNEQVIVVDDYCIIAGTDTNYPWTNQLDLKSIPFAQEVNDARFMVVCFEEPIFNIDFKLLDDTPMVLTASKAPTASTGSKAPTASKASKAGTTVGAVGGLTLVMSLLFTFQS